MKIANPRKVFQFKIEINGVDQFEVQTVDLPERELDSVSHGDTNHDIKTAGRLKVGDLVLEKLRLSDTADTWAANWMKQAQNFVTGGGLLPIQLKDIIIVKEMNAQGTQAVATHIMYGCWVKKIKKSKLDRNSSDNMLDTVTLSVDKYEEL